jgi:hypothetical protein
MTSAIVAVMVLALVAVSATQHFAVAKSVDPTHASHSAAMQGSVDNTDSHDRVPCDSVGTSEKSGPVSSDLADDNDCGSVCCNIGCASMLMYLTGVSHSSISVREVHEMNLVERSDGRSMFEFLRPPRS